MVEKTDTSHSENVVKPLLQSDLGSEDESQSDNDVILYELNQKTH